MRKRETLIESKKYVNKFDYTISKETFVQTIDSHLEALDQIDELGEKNQWYIERWHAEEDRANRLQLEVDELKHKVWLKDQVAKTYQKALADEYRPYVEENQTLRRVIELLGDDNEPADETGPERSD